MIKLQQKIIMFLEIFNELLSENELNKKQFAEKSGIPYTTVIGWTKLNRLPDYTALIKIADYFQCSLDYLTGRRSDYDSVIFASNVSSAEQTLIKNFRKLNSENKELIKSLTANLAGKNKDG